MLKRLAKPTGNIADNGTRPEDSTTELKRKAILVHSGPNGEGLVFMSSDGETKPFDTERIKRIVENQNAVVSKLAEEYGGFEKMPRGAFPPVKDQHESDSNDRIVGRMNALLSFEIMDVPGVGPNVACACTELTFLGEDTVTKVKDGRIYHLSVGIDENTDTLGEVSTVIEPAAPGAMLLSGKKGEAKTKKDTKGVSKMGLKLKRLQRHATRMEKLSAMQTDLKKLAEKAGETKKLIATTREKVEEGDRVGKVTHRLKKLVTEMKMTPVEFKALDIKKLSKMDQETLDVVFKAYDARPKVEGDQRGTTDAVEFAEIGQNLEQRQLKRLKAEAKKDLKRLGVKKFKDGDGDEDDKELAGDTHDLNKRMAEHGKEDEKEQKEKELAAEHEAESKLAAYCSRMKKHLESGNVEEAKKEHAELEKHMSSMKHMAGFEGDVKSEDEKKSLDMLQGQIDEIHTNMARMAGMVSELMDAEKEEGHDLEQKLNPKEEPGAGQVPGKEKEEHQPGEQAS